MIPFIIGGAIAVLGLGGAAVAILGSDDSSSSSAPTAEEARADQLKKEQNRLTNELNKELAGIVSRYGRKLDSGSISTWDQLKSFSDTPAIDKLNIVKTTVTANKDKEIERLDKEVKQLEEAKRTFII